MCITKPALVPSGEGWEAGRPVLIAIDIAITRKATDNTLVDYAAQSLAVQTSTTATPSTMTLDLAASTIESVSTDSYASSLGCTTNAWASFALATLQQRGVDLQAYAFR